MILKKEKNINLFAKKYLKNLEKIFNQINLNKISQLSQKLEECRKRNGSIYVIGNGGSAINGSAMANDLGFDILKKTKKRPFKIVSLTDNNAVSTAISNDIGFENLFLAQLKYQYKKNDILIVMSVSGNSKNLIHACKWFNGKGNYVYGILGCDGGRLKSLCDNYLIIPSKKGEYGPVEDMQLIINHILAHWYQIKFKL